MRMVWRVCARAGVRRLSPHQLRHGFANRFLWHAVRRALPAGRVAVVTDGSGLSGFVGSLQAEYPDL